MFCTQLKGAWLDSCFHHHRKPWQDPFSQLPGAAGWSRPHSLQHETWSSWPRPASSQQPTRAGGGGGHNLSTQSQASGGAACCHHQPMGQSMQRSGAAFLTWTWTLGSFASSVSLVLEKEPRALPMLSPCSATELQPSLRSRLLILNPATNTPP